MPSDHLSPTTREDETADRLVRRGRKVGAPWVVASVALLGISLVATTLPSGLAALAASAVALGIGLRARTRYWTSVRRQIGDATLQRAQWRNAAEERGSPDRITVAVGLLIVLLAFQVWRR